MSEKQTLSTWLRSKGVYEDEVARDSKPKPGPWREALLMEFDPVAQLAEQKPVLSNEGDSPLQARHLVLLAPVGLALFAVGWLFGSQTITMEQILRISPWVWVGGAVGASVGLWFWRNQIVYWSR